MNLNGSCEHVYIRKDSHLTEISDHEWLSWTVSGRSRGGTRPSLPSLFWVKKTKTQREEKLAGLGKQNRPPSPSAQLTESATDSSHGFIMKHILIKHGGRERGWGSEDIWSRSIVRFPWKYPILKSCDRSISINSWRNEFLLKVCALAVFRCWCWCNGNHLILLRCWYMTGSPRLYEETHCKKNIVTGDPKKNRTRDARMADDNHYYCATKTVWQYKWYYPYYYWKITANRLTQ